VDGTEKLTSNGSDQQFRGNLVYNDDRRDLQFWQSVCQSRSCGVVEDIQHDPAFLPCPRPS
jgi:hypothetical protein